MPEEDPLDTNSRRRHLLLCLTVGAAFAEPQSYVPFAIPLPRAVLTHIVRQSENNHKVLWQMGQWAVAKLFVEGLPHTGRSFLQVSQLCYAPTLRALPEIVPDGSQRHSKALAHGHLHTPQCKANWKQETAT